MRGILEQIRKDIGHWLLDVGFGRRTATEQEIKSHIRLFGTIDRLLGR